MCVEVAVQLTAASSRRSMRSKLDTMLASSWRLETSDRSAFAPRAASPSTLVWILAPCFVVPGRLNGDAWTFLSREEQASIERCNAPEPLKLLALFAMRTGLRQGEQMALTMDDIEVEGDAPHVSIRRGRRSGGPPKNNKVRRVVAVGLSPARAMVSTNLERRAKRRSRSTSRRGRHSAAAASEVAFAPAHLR